jgi:hypothetical protein
MMKMLRITATAKNSFVLSVSLGGLKMTFEARRMVCNE